MVQIDQKRVCPFCGTLLLLNACAVVSTTQTAEFGNGGGFGAFDDSAASDESDSAPRIGPYPVLRPAKAPGQTRLREKLFGDLKPVLNEFDGGLLPRRICGNCRTPLPLQMDEYDAYTLSVVGLNQAGKSYFIGAAFTAATAGGLLPFGVTRFEGLDDTDSRLHQEYYLALFRKKVGLPVTKVEDHLRRPPLVFLVEMNESDPFILVCHDVSGEVLIDRSKRAQKAGFVARASAVIFIADPLDMELVFDSLPAHAVPEAEFIMNRRLNQRALLTAILGELRPENGHQPLAFTVSKSDLLSQATHKPYPFNLPRPHKKPWRTEIVEEGDAVRTALWELNEGELVRIAEAHSPVTFHAVSVLGDSAARDAANGRPQPVRIVDPLGTVLEQLRLRQARSAYAT